MGVTEAGGSTRRRRGLLCTIGVVAITVGAVASVDVASTPAGDRHHATLTYQWDAAGERRVPAHGPRGPAVRVDAGAAGVGEGGGA